MREEGALVLPGIVLDSVGRNDSSHTN